MLLRHAGERRGRSKRDVHQAAVVIERFLLAKLSAAQDDFFHEAFARAQRIDEVVEILLIGDNSLGRVDLDGAVAAVDAVGVSGSGP